MKFELLVDSNSPTLRIFLAESGDGEIVLKGRDKDGFEWNIAKLTRKGALWLYSSLGEDTGLDIDGDGYIKTTHEQDT